MVVIFTVCDVDLTYTVILPFLGLFPWTLNVHEFLCDLISGLYYPGLFTFPVIFPYLVIFPYPVKNLQYKGLHICLKSIIVNCRKIWY